jgi:hypothetical protein
VETALALLRLALERGWTLGLLFVVFCGGALAAPRFGVELPDPVKQWSGAGLLFGVAVIIVSGTSHFLQLAGALLDSRARRRAAAAQRDAENRQVVANLGALTIENAEALERLLSSSADRFQVDILSDTYQLKQLGLLTTVRRMGGTSWVCELHPALAAQRENLTRHFREQLKKRYPQSY